tara:strand:- start:181 stop:495 length:315 start_codon:yes stop_codon:yes gene_type:complete
MQVQEFIVKNDKTIGTLISTSLCDSGKSCSCFFETPISKDAHIKLFEETSLSDVSSCLQEARRVLLEIKSDISSKTTHKTMFSGESEEFDTRNICVSASNQGTP